MEFETDNRTAMEHQGTGVPFTAGAPGQNHRMRGAKAYSEVKDALGTAYTKTSQGIRKGNDAARRFRNENPGSAMFIALGVGVGVGYLLRSNIHPSRNVRYARPVLHAISDIAERYFR